MVPPLILPKLDLAPWTLLALICLPPSTGSAQTNLRQDVGLFSRNDTSGWKIRKFSGSTDYSLISVDGQLVLAADSRQSASAFYKKVKVDLDKTPILNWSWRKEQPINPGNELDKKGDDFVARIYVVKSGGLFYWNTLALNYVWSYQHIKNDFWNNPFAGEKNKMLSQRDALDLKNVWFNEHRNVAIDFKQLLGKDIRHIDGIAIMTDSDNSGLSAKALYGDIYFSESDE